MDALFSPRRNGAGPVTVLTSLLNFPGVGDSLLLIESSNNPSESKSPVSGAAGNFIVEPR